MLTIKCTKKVQALLRLKQNELVDLSETPDQSVMGAWYVNEFRVERKKCLIFMNERTLLSFILFGVRKSNTNKDLLPDMCLEGVFQLLKLERFSLESISRIIEDSYESRYAKTDSRKVLGNMNELAATYEHMIWHEGGLAHCDLNDLFSRVNRTPQRNLGWNYSIDIARELLGAPAPQQSV